MPTRSIRLGSALTLLFAVTAAAQTRALTSADYARAEKLLGYNLGVAITGSERVGLTLVITEGFGEVPMAERTFALGDPGAARLLRASLEGVLGASSPAEVDIRRPERR